ncbi:MAG TPA: hypothetical protein VGQ83_13400 [Polyangia bacterium]|jgi:hypothetical protein
MIPVRTLSFPTVSSLMRGFSDLRRAGITPRGLLFLAVDLAGVTYLAIPENADDVEKIKVGDKLSLVWPFTDRAYYFDSVHRLPDDVVLFNGDRRLGNCASATEVALVTSMFLKTCGAKNVFFGCTPHQPGSWLCRDEDKAEALHPHGFVEVVPVSQGLLARRILDEHLFFLAHPDPWLEHLDAWLEVYSSPLGNILMLERRVLGNRIVLTCERGLAEVDLLGLPKVQERACFELTSGFGIVGRVDGGSFAVTSGDPQPWGLDNMKPALLVGASGGTLQELGATLAKRR